METANDINNLPGLDSVAGAFVRREVAFSLAVFAWHTHHRMTQKDLEERLDWRAGRISAALARPERNGPTIRELERLIGWNGAERTEKSQEISSRGLDRIS